MNRADRKKLLIAQGAVYRADACIARQAVRDGLQLRSLGAGALRQLARMSFALPGGGKGDPDTKRTLLLSLLPLLGGVMPALSRWKPAPRILLRGALLAAAAAGVAAAIIRQKNARATADRAP